MDIKTIITIASAVVAVLSLCTTAYLTLERRRVDAHFEYCSTMLKVHERLSAVPSALRFHGISEEDLAKAQVTREEFLYLVSNFSAGAVYFTAIKQNGDEALQSGSYRLELCRAEATRRAWPLLNRMLSGRDYKHAVEAAMNRVSPGPSVQVV